MSCGMCPCGRLPICCSANVMPPRAYSCRRLLLVRVVAFGLCESTMHRVSRDGLCGPCHGVRVCVRAPSEWHELGKLTSFDTVWRWSLMSSCDELIAISAVHLLL